MHSVNELSRMIINHAEGIAPDTIGAEKRKIEMAAQFINWFLDDLFTLYNNIGATSLNDKDRSDRIAELQIKYGISVKNLL